MTYVQVRGHLIPSAILYVARWWMTFVEAGVMTTFIATVLIVRKQL